VNIGNKKVAVEIFLHPYEIAHCTKIITEVQITCGANSANNNWFIHFKYAELKTVQK
jgi:hypothetical protein